MSLKSELKNGAVVKTRNGNMYVKVDDTLLNINMSGMYSILNDYSEDLTAKSNLRTWDIVKINNNTNGQSGYCYRAIVDVQRNIWTWERPVEILNEKEKEYLSAVIKPFRDRVEYITKRNYIGNGEYDICIDLIEDFMTLPYFKSNKMYKNMKLNKKYTLAELGL